jgi:hypothetical protein
VKYKHEHQKLNYKKGQRKKGGQKRMAYNTRGYILESDIGEGPLFPNDSLPHGVSFDELVRIANDAKQHHFMLVTMYLSPSFPFFYFSLFLIRSLSLYLFFSFVFFIFLLLFVN